MPKDKVMTLEHPFAQYARLPDKGGHGSRSLLQQESCKVMRVILALTGRADSTQSAAALARKMWESRAVERFGAA